MARGQVGGALGDAVASSHVAAAAAGGAGADDAATNTTNNAASNAAAAADDASLAGTSRAAANAAGGAAAAVASIENANDGLSWGHAAIGVLRGTLDAIIFGCKGGIMQLESLEIEKDRGSVGVVQLTLNLLLGVAGLRVGLVLDEEDLWLAGNGWCWCRNVVDLQRGVLLAEHIDDSLLLLGGILGRQFDVGAARRGRFDEHHAVILLWATDNQMLDTLQILMLLRCGHSDKLLVHKGCLERDALLLLLLLLVAWCLVASKSAKANVGCGSEAGEAAASVASVAIVAG